MAIRLPTKLMDVTSSMSKKMTYYNVQSKDVTSTSKNNTEEL